MWPSAAQANQLKRQVLSLSDAELRSGLFTLIDSYLEVLGLYDFQERMASEMAIQFQQKEDECQGLQKQLMEREDQLKFQTELSIRLAGQLGLRVDETFGVSSEKGSSIMGKTADKAGGQKEENKENEREKDRQDPSAQNKDPKENGAAENQNPPSKKQAPDSKTDSEKEKKPRAPYKSRQEKYKSLPVRMSYQWTPEEITELFGSDWQFSHFELHDSIGVIPVFLFVDRVATPVIYVKGEAVHLPLKENVLPKSDMSAAFGAWLVTQKFQYFMPVNRISTALTSQGVNMSRQNLTHKLARITGEYLSGAADYMRKKLIEEDHIQSDETPLKVLKGEGENNFQAYMWIETTSELTERYRIIIYNYRRHRSTDDLASILTDTWTGTATSDGFSSYSCFAKQDENRISTGCWTHFRRYWVDGYKVLKFAGPLNKVNREAVENSPEARVIQKIGEIYFLDTPAKKISAAERKKIRDEKIRPLVDELFVLIHKFAAEIDTHGFSDKTKAAIYYGINNEQALRVFLDDPLVPIDNNYVEQKVRSVALAKRSWDWFGSEDGARIAADNLTLIETAKANDAIPFYYIEYLLKNMPEHLNDPASNLDFYEDLMPWSEEYKEYERQAKQHFPDLSRLVWPDQKEEEPMSWFPPLMYEKPSMKKADRIKAAEIIQAKLATAAA